MNLYCIVSVLSIKCTGKLATFANIWTVILQINVMIKASQLFIMLSYRIYIFLKHKSDATFISKLDDLMMKCFLMQFSHGIEKILRVIPKDPRYSWNLIGSQTLSALCLSHTLQHGQERQCKKAKQNLKTFQRDFWIMTLVEVSAFSIAVSQCSSARQLSLSA